MNYRKAISLRSRHQGVRIGIRDDVPGDQRVAANGSDGLNAGIGQRIVDNLIASSLILKFDATLGDILHGQVLCDYVVIDNGVDAKEDAGCN